MATESNSPNQQETPDSTRRQQRQRTVLFVSIFFVAGSGLAYELIAGSMATYLVGQSITQFSFATGWFLAAMGLGSYLSRYARKNLLETFIAVQVALAVVGGFSAALMFLVFAHTDTIYPIFISLALFIGAGMGLEIPLILRLVQRYRITRLAVSDVFTWDYLGALGASLLFPLFVLPSMGLIRSSLFFGFLNLLAAWFARTMLPGRRYVLALSLATFALIAGFLGAEKMTRWIESRLYQDPILLSRTTPYQRIIVTRWKDDVRLYLNGNLQLSSRDEARYHEPLAHLPAASLAKAPVSALVLGGGDGMLIRELLRWPSIAKIVLVDLDPEMVRLFSQRRFLKEVNGNSLNSPRVQIVTADAFRWLKEHRGKETYDLILADLPDPNSFSLGKLYTVTFYLHAYRRLTPTGIFVTQATSPLYAPDAFVNIADTMREACRLSRLGCQTSIFHSYVPSFGDWGFVAASRQALQPQRDWKFPAGLRYLTKEVAPTLFVFAPDFAARVRPGPNRLNNQVLVKVYNDSWDRWFE